MMSILRVRCRAITVRLWIWVALDNPEYVVVDGQFACGLPSAEMC